MHQTRLVPPTQQTHRIPAQHANPMMTALRESATTTAPVSHVTWPASATQIVLMTSIAHFHPEHHLTPLSQAHVPRPVAGQRSVHSAKNVSTGDALATTTAIPHRIAAIVPPTRCATVKRGPAMRCQASVTLVNSVHVIGFATAAMFASTWITLAGARLILTAQTRLAVKMAAAA